MHSFFRIALLSLAFLPGAVARADDRDPEGLPFGSSPGWEGDHEKRLRWFRDARFGMFIHLGLYSAAGSYWPPDPATGKVYDKEDASLIRTWAAVDEPAYGQALKPLFLPEKGCTDEWARLAKEAGMRYAVFTAKNPEGYTLFESRQPFSVKNPVTGSTNVSPSGRDLFCEFVDSFRREGLVPGVYYSLVDWQYPDAGYHDYLEGQLHELATGYGPLGVLWVDYATANHQGSYWNCRSILDDWRKNQPSSVVNNRFWSGFENGNGDFFTPDTYILPAPPPGGATFEVSLPLNNSYGFSYTDNKWKSPRQILQTLSEISSKGGNLLLNIAPDARGHVPSQCTETLESVGRWLSIHGQAIFDTEPSPFKNMPFKGACTVGTNAEGKSVLYCHLYEWPSGGTLPLAGLVTDCESATLLGTLPLKLSLDRASWPLVHIPAYPPYPDDLLPVIAVVLKDKPVVDSTTYPRQAADRSIFIPASQAVLAPGPDTRYPLRMEDDHIGWWSRQADSAWFPILMKEPAAPGKTGPGRYRVVLDYSVAPTCGGEVEVRLLDQVLKMKIEPTGGWSDFRAIEAGQVTISQPGLMALHIRPLQILGYGLMNLRSVRIVPVAEETPTDSH